MTSKTHAAFISYSHAVDGALAPAIKAALERLAKPWHRRRAMRVFHDRASLSVNPSLWSTLQNILSDTEYFVLLASPESAASEWVNREVEFWLRQSPPSRLLIVLTDGEIAWDNVKGDFAWPATTALSNTLSGVFHDEPLYLDLRWARSASQLTLKHPPFYAAMAELAATIRGCPKDDIVGEDLASHRRTIRLAWSAVAALTALAILASSAAVLFVRQRTVARQRELEARQHLYAAHINQALVAVGSGGIDRAATILASDLPQPGDPDLRSFEWYYLWTLSHRELASLLADGEAVVAYSPDGRYLAAGTQLVSSGRGDSLTQLANELTGQLRIWDRQSGRTIATRRYDRPIAAISFSPDGKTLAAVTNSSGPSAIEGDDVLLIKAETGDIEWQRRDRSTFKAVAFHPDGRFVATGGFASPLDSAGPFDARGQVTLWNVADGSRTGLPVGAIAWVSAVAFSPRGTELAIAWDFGPAVGRPEVWIWSLVDRRVVDRVEGSGRYTTTLKYSADGSRLLIANDDGVVVSWHLSPKARETVLRGHRGPVLSLSLASNGPIAATGGWDRTARLWNWQTGQAIAILPTHANAVESVAFSPDDRVLATSANGVIKLWNVSAEIGDDSTLQAHMGGLNALAFSTDGRFFSTAGADGRVTVWDAASRRETMTFELVRGSTTPADAQTTATAIIDAIDKRTPVSSVAFSPTGAQLAATGRAGTVIWDLASRRTIYTDRDGPGESLVYAPDGRRVFVSGERGLFAIDPSRSTQSRFAQERAEVVAVSPAGNRLATAWTPDGPEKSNVLLWNTTTGSRVCDLAAPEQGVFSLAFSPDGRLLASAGNDARVWVWKVDACTQLTILGGQDAAGLLAFSPDGRTLAIARSTLGLGDSGSISLWSTATWEELFSLPAGIAGIHALAFSPTGNMMVAAGDDHVLNERGKVRFWPAHRF